MENAVDSEDTVPIQEWYQLPNCSFVPSEAFHIQEELAVLKPVFLLYHSLWDIGWQPELSMAACAYEAALAKQSLTAVMPKAS